MTKIQLIPRRTDVSQQMLYRHISSWPPLRRAVPQQAHLRRTYLQQMGSIRRVYSRRVYGRCISSSSLRRTRSPTSASSADISPEGRSPIRISSNHITGRHVPDRHTLPIASPAAAGTVHPASHPCSGRRPPISTSSAITHFQPACLPPP
jgi:hypothetical protein